MFVVPERGLTLAAAVDAVTRLQFLPALRGGSRSWTASVDGRPVGELTQRWEHPVHWPPVEFHSDPEAPFTGRRACFSLGETPIPETVMEYGDGDRSTIVRRAGA